MTTLRLNKDSHKLEEIPITDGDTSRFDLPVIEDLPETSKMLVKKAVNTSAATFTHDSEKRRALFKKQFAQCRTREQLLALMASIDESKRALKLTITTLSETPKELTRVDRHERIQKLNRYKSVMPHLQREREQVRNKIAEINKRDKGINKRINSSSTVFANVFLAIAEAELDEEVFADLEHRTNAFIRSHSKG